MPARLRRSLWTSENLTGPRRLLISARIAVGRRHRTRLGKIATGYRSGALPEPAGPVVVAGMFRSASGLGEAARMTVRSLRSAGLETVAVDVTDCLTRPDLDPGIPLSELPRNRAGTLILHVNAPETLRALEAMRFLDGIDWRIISYWAWELPAFPSGWEEEFPCVTKVWAINEGFADILRRHPDAPPVESFPIAIDPPPSVAADRGKFGISGNRHTVLALADALSSLSRKNPLGAIEAFKAAFGDSSDHELIVKTRNFDLVPKASAAIRNAIGGARNIRLLDSVLTRQELWELLASVDVVLSLHRAEGFGLPLAEAMAVGTPVVATGWSGNMSFMTPETSVPVKYSLVPARDEFGRYGDYSACWAEPDIRDAAEALQRLAGQPDLAAALGAKGRERVRSLLHQEAIGRRMRASIGR